MKRIAATLTKRARRAAAPRERGAVLVFVAALLLAMMVFTAFAVDLGRAYFAQRHLQSAADAAALAGAQELPNGGAAAAVAAQYDGTSGGKNEHSNISVTSTSVSTKCLSSAPGCDPVNAVVVEQTTEVETLFAKIIGINSISVSVKATACSPCGAKPLDIMLVLDRTGSMCQDSSGNSDPACTDLNNARDGMKTFLSFLDSNSDHVGLTVFPPATGSACSRPSTTNYHDPGAAYTVVGLSDDFTNGGSLDSSSALVSTIDCQDGRGRTAYANALESAQAELAANGRPEIDDIIIFFSDGAANIGPNYYPNSSPYRARPCAQGVSSAAAINAAGTTIYSIGYDLNALGGGANVCRNSNRRLEQPAITAMAALQGIASRPDTFFNKPTAGDLNAIFTSIAADIGRGKARLVDDATP